jgi:hypothetical protein
VSATHPSTQDTGWRRVTAEGIYGSLAISVVCLAWEGDDPRELALEVLVYSVALWLFHVYARVVHGGWQHRTWAGIRHWAQHEWPHLQAALPAIAVALVGSAAGLSPLRVADLALAVTVANLLAWQVLLLRPERPSVPAYLLTLGLDILVLGALLALRLQVK